MGSPSWPHSARMVQPQLGAAVAPRSRKGEDKTNPKVPPTPPIPTTGAGRGQHTHVGIAGSPVPAPSLPLGHENHLLKKISLLGWEIVGMGNHRGVEKPSLRWETITSITITTPVPAWVAGAPLPYAATYTYIYMCRARNGSSDSTLSWPREFCPGIRTHPSRAGFSSPWHLIPKRVLGSSALCPAWKDPAGISSWERSPFSRGRKTTWISINAGRPEASAAGGGEGPARLARPSGGARLSGCPTAIWAQRGLLPPPRGNQVEPPSFPANPVISARPMLASRIRPWEGAAAASGCEAGTG